VHSLTSLKKALEQLRAILDEALLSTIAHKVKNLFYLLDEDNFLCWAGDRPEL